MERRKIKSIKIVSTDDMSELNRIDTQLKALILSMEGTIPGSRGFGLRRDFASRPIHEAINLFAIELEEKVEEFIPEITIANVECLPSVEGFIEPTIYVERRM